MCLQDQLELIRLRERMLSLRECGCFLVYRKGLFRFYKDQQSLRQGNLAKQKCIEFHPFQNITLQINSIIKRNKKPIHNSHKIKSSRFQPRINSKRSKLARSGYDVQHGPTLKSSSGNIEKS